MPSEITVAVETQAAQSHPNTMRSMMAQLARFCSVGALCLATATAGLAVLHDVVGIYYLTAYVTSFCLGNVLGYVLNGRLTFNAPVHASGGARYLLLNITLLAINSALMKLLVDGLHIWYIGAALILAVTTTPISFLLHRKFSYSASSSLSETFQRPSQSAQ